MNKTYLIFKHEFFHTIKKPGWIIMTLIVPVLALLGIGVFALVKNLSEPPEKVIQAIGYVDETAMFNEKTDQGYTKFYRFNSKDEVLQAMGRGEIGEYFMIPEDYFSTGKIYRYTLGKELGTSSATYSAIKTFLSQNLLEGKVSKETEMLIVSPINLEVTRITESGGIADEQSSLGYLLVAGVFSLMLGFSLMFGATTLISGLGEEKESRLIEILFSSVSIRQLLVGKVLALGIAGLAQVLIWLISAPFILSLASSTFGGIMNNLQLPIDFLVLGVIFFILGYLLFAVLSIGVGAISSNAREGGQLSTIYTMASFIPLWFSSLLIAFPNGAAWTVLSLIPITAPVQIMIRMGVSDIPLWQIITSIILLIISIIAGLYFSIRIFRFNMLKHGEKPGLKAIISGIKNS
ncbi:MAG: ABC transporter permease [Prolixibacteraceae bacterium]|nr:ABC transporter permease [Prolixibacteraceae bacterium]